jgi:pyruvate dehydrogenase E1 component beta subunit
VVRLAGEDIPISVSVALEKASVPTAETVFETARRLVA